MGKASRWFRGLLGFKTTANADQSKAAPPPPPLTAKKKWSIVRRDRQKPHHESAGDSDADASRHAIAVAEATAAAAEAAVAAAQAAAAVVQLTSSGRNISAPGGGADASRGAACVSRSGGGFRSREEWAAVTIQSHFRGYLARRALRALKGLVKLQALVKGHLVRKQTAYTLKRLQALVRAQVRARAGRVLISESPMKSAQFNYAGPATPEKFEHHDVIRARSMKHQQVMMLKRKCSKSSSSVNYDSEKPRTNSAWTGERLSEQGCLTRTLHTDDDRTDKILEVDPGNPRAISKRRPLFYSSHLSLSSDQNCQSISTSKESTAHCQSVLSSSEVQSVSPMKLTQDADESTFCTADNSPTFYSSSSRGGSAKQGAFTPTKSDGSRSCLSGYSDHPNYMSYTESSKAKARSHSAPKQRPQYDRSGSTKRYSVHTHSGDSTRPAQKSSSLQPNFSNRPYPGSGLLDRLGMPVRGNNDGFSGGHWHQY